MNKLAIAIWLSEWVDPNGYTNPGLFFNIQPEGLVL
jgi:hypothetical protein